jgi:hypothetical protein
MIGTNPRFENSSLHLHLRNMANESPVNIYSLNSFNNLSFKNKTLSSSNKYMINLFQGKSKFLKNLFKNEKNLLIFGLNTINNKYKNNAGFQSQFLNLKLYNLNNPKNDFIALSSNLSSLINNEFNMYQTPKNLNNFGLVNKINLQHDLISLQTTNLNNISNIQVQNSYILNYFNIKKLANLKNETKILKKKLYTNIVNNYEKDSFIFNFSGLLLKSPKIIYKQSNSKKILLNLANNLILKENLNDLLLNNTNNLYNYSKNKKTLNKN